MSSIELNGERNKENIEKKLNIRFVQDTNILTFTPENETDWRKEIISIYE